MTVRQRTAIAVLAACAAVTIVLYFVVGSILAADAADLEKKRAGQTLERASDALYQDVASVDAAVGVWARWDDSYQFMQDRNEGYIASNLAVSTLLNLDVDFVVYVDPQGRVFYSRAVDASTGTETSLPPGLEQFVTGEGLLATHNSEMASVAGTLFLPDHLALVSSRPIVTSQGQGPMAGALVMGRYLDPVEVEKLSQATGLALELHRVDDPETPEDFQVARSSLSQQENTFIRILDGRTISSYVLVKEINGSPAFVLGVDEPRDIYAQGQQTARQVLYLLAGAGVLLSLLILLEVDVLVMARWRRFNRGVAEAGSNHDLSARVAVGGKDEVAAAAALINNTLDSLERSNRDLAESEARYRALVEAIPDLVFRINREGTILEVRKPQKVASLAGMPEVPDGQPSKDEIIDLIPTQIQHIVLPHVARAIESRQTQTFEFQMSVDGAMSYHEARVLGNGSAEGLVIVRDVTDQKRVEESRQNTSLLREIHNRVKNHLQLIRSLPGAHPRAPGDLGPGPGDTGPGPGDNGHGPGDNGHGPEDNGHGPADTGPGPGAEAEGQRQNADVVDAGRSSKGS